MSIDKQALRQLAEGVGREEWQARKEPGISGEHTVIVKGSLVKHSGWSTHRPVADQVVDKKTSKFIAAANPATVIALLDELEPMALAQLNLNLLCEVYRLAYEEARHNGLVNWEAAASLAEENEDLKCKLEAAERRNAEQEDLLDAEVRLWTQRYDCANSRREAAEKSNAFLKDQLSELANFNPDWDKLEASYESWREIAAELLVAKDRIAELEAREVVLPQRQEPTSSGHYGEGYLVPCNGGSALDYDDTVEALAAAGISVKGE